MVKTIPYWKLSNRVIVYPHLEFDELYSYEELINIVNDMKSFYEESINMVVFEKNTYCSEVNGLWNVCFGVVDDEGRTFMYMLRRDMDLGKSYACPFQNTDYVYDIKHSILDGKINRCPEEFALIEKYLTEKLSAKRISAFPTEKENTRKRDSFNYDPDDGDPYPTAVKIPIPGWEPKLV